MWMRSDRVYTRLLFLKWKRMLNKYLKCTSWYVFMDRTHLRAWWSGWWRSGRTDWAWLWAWLIVLWAFPNPVISERSYEGLCPCCHFCLYFHLEERKRGREVKTQYKSPALFFNENDFAVSRMSALICNSAVVHIYIYIYIIPRCHKRDKTT